MNIIPAIDIRNGECVRLTQGDYDNCKIYHSNPVEVAQAFEAIGLKRLHLVDLDGAKAGSIQNLEVLRNICSATELEVDFSGGVKSESDLINAFEAGARYVGIGSMAVKEPEVVAAWLKKYGGDRIILGADVWNEQIAIMGWTEQTDTSIDAFIDFYIDNLKYLVCTDISKDGMLEGPSLALYKTLRDKYPAVQLIASGGVSKLQDLDDLKKIGVEGVIVGKAIYENKITLNELKSWISQ